MLNTILEVLGSDVGQQLLDFITTKDAAKSYLFGGALNEE